MLTPVRCPSQTGRDLQPARHHHHHVPSLPCTCTGPKQRTTTCTYSWVGGRALPGYQTLKSAGRRTFPGSVSDISSPACLKKGFEMFNRGSHHAPVGTLRHPPINGKYCNNMLKVDLWNPKGLFLCSSQAQTPRAARGSPVLAAHRLWKPGQPMPRSCRREASAPSLCTSSQTVDGAWVTPRTPRSAVAAGRQRHHHRLVDVRGGGLGDVVGDVEGRAQLGDGGGRPAQ